MSGTPPPKALPHVTILLCTANGGRFLEAQLASYLAQSHRDWSLWVSDDGSRDDTLAQIAAFARAHGDAHEVRVVAGPGQGAAANFLSLLNHPELPEGPVALSDQDDVWLPDKLTRALTRMARAQGENGNGSGVLYGAQSLHVREDLRAIAPSRPPRRPPSFANALTQNIVSGHSAVLDPAALALVRRAGLPAGVEHHDWWLYQLLAGAGARIEIDEAVVLKYRQHGRNVMGAHRGWRARAGRMKMLFDGTYGDWVKANVAALGRVESLLTPDNRDRLAQVRASLGRGPAGAWQLRRAGLYRQSPGASALFYAAAALGRI